MEKIKIGEMDGPGLSTSTSKLTQIPDKKVVSTSAKSASEEALTHHKGVEARPVDSGAHKVPKAPPIKTTLDDDFYHPKPFGGIPDEKVGSTSAKGAFEEALTHHKGVEARPADSGAHKVPKAPPIKTTLDDEFYHPTPFKVDGEQGN